MYNPTDNNDTDGSKKRSRLPIAVAAVVAVLCAGFVIDVALYEIGSITKDLAVAVGTGLALTMNLAIIVVIAIMVTSRKPNRDRYMERVSEREQEDGKE